jgi:hypothetical protein
MQCIVMCVLICIYSYLKSVLKYKYIILDTRHPDSLYLREQGCKDACLFFEAKKVREQTIWETLVYCVVEHSQKHKAQY